MGVRHRVLQLVPRAAVRPLPHPLHHRVRHPAQYQDPPANQAVWDPPDPLGVQDPLACPDVWGLWAQWVQWDPLGVQVPLHPLPLSVHPSASISVWRSVHNNAVYHPHPHPHPQWHTRAPHPAHRLVVAVRSKPASDKNGNNFSREKVFTIVSILLEQQQIQDMQKMKIFTSSFACKYFSCI